MRQPAVMSVLGAFALAPWLFAAPLPAGAAGGSATDATMAERTLRAAIAATPTSHPEPVPSARVLVADVDGDEIHDLLLADPLRGGRTLYSGIGSGGFASGTSPEPAALAPFEALLAGTVEPRDESRSLAFLLAGSAGGGFELPVVAFRTRVRAGDPPTPAGFDAGSIHAPNGLPGGIVLAAEVRDADGDGDLDLAVLAPAPAPVAAKEGGDLDAGAAAGGPRLSLLGSNPSARGVSLAFALSRPGPVSLEAVDVRGRVVLRRELAGLTPGRHTIELARPGRLPPGLYLVRLRQQQEQAAVKVVVLH